MEGFENYDISDGVDIRDLSRWQENTVDVIYMSHVLEHVGVREYGRVLLECRRILKPDGKLIVSVPDIEKSIGLEPFEVAMQHLYGGQTNDNDFHRCGFKFDWLKQSLERTAFNRIEQIEPFAPDCSQYPDSMTVIAHKRPDFAIKDEPKVAMCLSYPRVGFTKNTECLLDLVAQTGWPRSTYTGAFWDRDLTIAMKRAVEAGADYVLTVDFDSLFTPEDVLTLMDFMQKHPKVGACFPVQMSRFTDKPLVHDERRKYDGDYTEVDCGHFGLTLIRTDMLREIPQPWLWSMPGQDGNWQSTDRLDADVKFWLRARHLGFRIAQINRVYIGHVEQCVKWGGPDGRIMYQPINNYGANGKPEGVGVLTAKEGDS